MLTRHDLQDLRRRVLLDRRAVEEHALEPLDVLNGVIEHLELLLRKQDEQGETTTDENDYSNPMHPDFDPKSAQDRGY